ncbi:MAG TPA: hypothetical protein VF461_08075 [Gemmatimonadaceae bacterium]
MTTRFCVAALLVLAVSCGGSSSSTPGGAPSPSRVERKAYVISEAELQDPAVVSKDAMSALRSLRPNFFAYRGPTGSAEPGAGEVMVSTDFGPLQSSQSLKGMNTMGLVEVRYLKPDEAALRFGLNANSAPVIVLLHNKNQ